MTRRELITRLITTYHLNVEERRLLEGGNVRRAELEEIIGELLDKHGDFPPGGASASTGEGMHIELRKDGTVWGLWQRADPIRPWVIVERKDRRYADRIAAIRGYLDSEWPRDIDGVPIVR